MSNRVVIAALALAASVSAAGLLAVGSSGRTEGQRTIGIVFPDPNTGAPLSHEVEHGGSAAASALGDDLVIIPADGPEAMISAVKSLIAQHAAAIAVNTDQGPDTRTLGVLRPALPLNHLPAARRAAEAYVQRGDLGATRPPADLAGHPLRDSRRPPAPYGDFSADSRAGSARDGKKPAVVMSNTFIDLQGFYGSDGTRTRDLRRDRPAF